MRVLLLHAKYFCFKPNKPALKEGYEKISQAEKKCCENCVIAFVTIEDIDTKNYEEVVEKAIEDILDYMNTVKADKLVIYPYAHLSSYLAPPDKALEILDSLTEKAKAKNVELLRAPFGWYKEFEVHCYGHPLAELSRAYVPRAVKRAKVEKKYFILTPDGSIFEPEEYLPRADEELRILIEKEALGKSLEEGENPVIKYCSKFGFEWEPYSDYGHMRYQPHATLMVEAVSRYSWYVARRLGIPILVVKGTNMFDLALKPVREHAELFGDRLYEFWADKKHLVLRYAACHQQFAMLKDYILSYRDLPLGVFEVADSYRFEQTGELTLCFRLRKFLMPDLHILTRDVTEARKIILDRVQKVIHEEAAKLGRRYVAVYNVTEDFWRNSLNDIVEHVRADGRPAVVAVYPSALYYWILNVEYHIIDVAKRPREIATYQIDVGNAKRFNIKYVDGKGNEIHPIIIHTALIGSVERYIYMVFDAAAQLEAKGRTPYIPTWLAPIQVRLIPLDVDKHMSFTEKVADLLESHNIRVDVDDRREGLGKRIRDAAREWIPYIGVIGDREVNTGTINVTIRRTNDRVAVKPEELLTMIEKELEGYPKVEPTLPRHVSQRPTLVYLEKPLKGTSSAR